MPPDHPGADNGSDARVSGSDGPVACFVPTDCPAGLTCCLVFTSSSTGEVSCRASAFCVGDGVSTWIACVTAADCPPARPKCVFLASTNRGDFSVCSN